MEMEVVFQKDGSEIVAQIIGRINTITAPELESQLKEKLDGITELVLDFAGVVYISSAGLRVILATDQLISDAGGTMVLRNVNDDVKEIFEMTGFDSLLNFA